MLAHVISKDYGEAAVVGVDRSSMLAMRERDPAMFDSLLLGGNPGIGIGGLTALSGFGGGNSDAGTGAGAGSSLASENFMTTNLLFRWLVRLDLSRCGLTAADLAGLAAPQAPPSAHRVTDDVDVDLAVVASHGNAGSFERCALRVLKLGDNPLTRVGARAGPGRGRGVSDAVERAAEHGLAALQDLIVRAPSLELLDLSGVRRVAVAIWLFDAVVDNFD